MCLNLQSVLKLIELHRISMFLKHNNSDIKHNGYSKSTVLMSKIRKIIRNHIQLNSKFIEKRCLSEATMDLECVSFL